MTVHEGDGTQQQIARLSDELGRLYKEQFGRVRPRCRRGHDTEG